MNHSNFIIRPTHPCKKSISIVLQDHTAPGKEGFQHIVVENVVAANMRFCEDQAKLEGLLPGAEVGKAPTAVVVGVSEWESSSDFRVVTCLFRKMMFLKILFLNGVLSFGFFGVPKSSFELLGPIHLVLRPRICSNVNPYLYKAKIKTPCVT